MSESVVSPISWVVLISLGATRVKWLLIGLVLAGTAGAAGYFYINQQVKQAQELTEQLLVDAPAVPTELTDVFSVKGVRNLKGYWMQCTHSMALSDDEGNKAFIYNVTVVHFPGDREVTYYSREMDSCPSPVEYARGQYYAHLTTHQTFWLINKRALTGVGWYRGMMNERFIPEGMPETLDVIAYEEMSDGDGSKSKAYFYIDDATPEIKLYRGGTEDLDLMSVSPWVFLGEEIVNSSIEVGEPVVETEKEKAERAYRSELAELTGQDYIDYLRGIEALFIKLSEDNEQVTREKVALLKRYASVADYEYTGEEAYPYSIGLLDTTLGYMELHCVGCENTTYMTYWNVSDGSQLVGIVNRGCGPVCEDSIGFVSFKGEERKDIAADDLMPKISMYDFLLDPQNRAYLEQDAWELSYNLPRDGKNILVKLDGATNAEVFKGNCVRFLWQDGRFAQGEFSMQCN